MGLGFVAIPGSLRQGSFARAIASTLDELAPDDVAVEVLGTLGDLPLYDQDLHGRGTPAAVAAAGELVAAADALVIVSPEYNHSLPGALKNAIDWLSRLPARPLDGKPVAIQTCSPGLLGGARAYEHIRQVVAACGGEVLTRPEVIVTQVGDKVDIGIGTIRDGATRQHVSRQLAALAASARLLGRQVA